MAPGLVRAGLALNLFYYDASAPCGIGAKAQDQFVMVPIALAAWNLSPLDHFQTSALEQVRPQARTLVRASPRTGTEA